LDQSEYSPGVWGKGGGAGGESKSFEGASRTLKRLADLEISGREVNRLTQKIGEELANAEQERVKQHQNTQLEVEVKNPPEAVVVECDGGRIRVRAEGEGAGVHQPAWRETKNACLLRVQSETRADDPHPELPRCFTDHQHMAELVRGVKNAENCHPEETEGPKDTGTEIAADKGSRERQPWEPERLVRTCLSGMCTSNEFGPRMEAEAQRRGFFAASRAAFLGDGQAWNWTIHRRHFPGFVAILDFIHAVTYVYMAAMAVSTDRPKGWLLYLRWATAGWQGHVADVISELKTYQSQLGPIPDGEKLPENDPRVVVGKTLTYLQNNRERMNYPRYRCLGLPVTSVLVESLIKEINHRVKGTEKFWNDPTGAEPILQVRAALLSEDERLARHLTSRPGSAYYRRASEPLTAA